MSDSHVRVTFGPRVLDPGVYELQDAEARRTGGGMFGERVLGTVAAADAALPIPPTAPPVSDDLPPDLPTEAPATIKDLHAALAEHSEHVHVLTALELAREDGPRKGALLALRAVSEARQSVDADAAPTVADIDTALTALAGA